MSRGSALASIALFAALCVTACRQPRDPAAPSGAPPLDEKSASACDVERARQLADDGERAAAIDLETAITRYAEATALDRKNDRYLVRLAALLRKKEDWSREARTLAAASEIAPDRADYLRDQGIALAKALDASSPNTEDLRALQAVFSQCLARDPSLAACEHGLGLAFGRAGDDQQALLHLTSAVRRAPNQLDPYLSLAGLYEVLGDEGRADSVLREALSRAAATPLELGLARIRLARVLLAKGEYRDAVAELEQAKRDDPDGAHVELPFWLGVSYARSSPPRAEDALAHLRAFQRRVCKGALASRYRDECEVSAATVRHLGAGQ